jgi:hypothetical protein
MFPKQEEEDPVEQELFIGKHFFAILDIIVCYFLEEEEGILPIA